MGKPSGWAYFYTIQPCGPLSVQAQNEAVLFLYRDGTWHRAARRPAWFEDEVMWWQEHLSTVVQRGQWVGMTYASPYLRTWWLL